MCSDISEILLLPIYITYMYIRVKYDKPVASKNSITEMSPYDRYSVKFT
jgi:hypothetical protein